QGADSIFLTGHPPHGTKPDRQRGSRILKNRPRRHRDLMPATGTLPASRSQRPRFGLAAARTAKPFWPAQAELIVPAVLLAAESSFEFRQCPRIVLLQLFHKPPHYLLWLPESSGYPNSAFLLGVDLASLGTAEEADVVETFLSRVSNETDALWMLFVHAGAQAGDRVEDAARLQLAAFVQGFRGRV